MNARLVHNHGIDPSCRERLVGECQLRPGIVHIDPDDAEQVERLTDAYAKAAQLLDNPAFRQPRVRAVAAALREFASPTPPKCDSVLNIAGVHFHCDRDMGHDFGAHGNRDAHAIWSAS